MQIILRQLTTSSVAALKILQKQRQKYQKLFKIQYKKKQQNEQKIFNSIRQATTTNIYYFNGFLNYFVSNSYKIIIRQTRTKATTPITTATTKTATKATTTTTTTPIIITTTTTMTKKKCTSYVETAAAAAAAVTKFSTINVNQIDDNNSINNINNINSSTTKSCIPTQKQFIVQLSTDLEPNELIGLTGDTKTLGEWQLERCIVLHRLRNLQWSTNILLPSCQDVKYRYFIYVLDNNGRKQIRRWETQLKSRTLKSCNFNCLQVDRFGEIAMGEQEQQQQQQQQQVNRGFLINDSIIQFKFEREKMFQVLDIEKFDPENIFIKIIPLKDDNNLQTAIETVNTGINIEIVKFKYGESQLQPQQTFGIEYKRGDIVIFHITIPNPLQNAFALIFHTTEQRPIGKTFVKLSDLRGSDGVLELIITEPEEDAKIKIATLTLPYVIVKPYNDTILDFHTAHAHYWPKSWSSLDVGHRGNGKSFIANPPLERENTIASFMRAYDSLADMIELDVHLTSDGVPIIYHDFGLRTAPQNKKITNATQLEFVLIKDVSYEALKKLRVFAVINEQVVEYPAHVKEPRFEHRIFPRLIEVLEHLPKTLGIDVEIKWPQARASGKIDARQTIDKNFFIDRILMTIITHGCDRPLIFSSFDADICTMLRFKQNYIPVMFLTNGETKKYMPYMDLRTRTFEQAINNAQAFELIGTAPHAEDFLGDNGAEMMQKSRNLGQITLVWGDDLNTKERVKYFSEIGATAICYDRADLLMPKGKERSFFNSTNLMAEFEG